MILAHILQRILYGPLRDLEVESLYEKAWYAVTETCLAMTIFRDEWNVGFVLCFAGLLFAKGFCWLSSGRVEMVSCTIPTSTQIALTNISHLKHTVGVPADILSLDGTNSTVSSHTALCHTQSLNHVP